MIALLQNDLDFTKRKLAYYTELKAKNPTKKASPADRWIEIYSERIEKLNKQIAKAAAQAAQATLRANEALNARPGLKTQVAASKSASRSKRA